MAKLTTIEGIGAATAEKLKKAGIGSVEKLLTIGFDKKGRMVIQQKTGISADKLLILVNHADLMRIKGIGGEYSELLEAAGVDSVPELAQRKAPNLRAKMAEVNAKKKLVRQLASESQVSSWIAQAKKLKKVVTH
jgi:predicted flap endonuclease-1-like 5' DNA nuclease